MERAAIIDLRVLQELRETAGPEFVAELAQTFAEDVPGMLSALDDARAAGDTVAFRRAAHSLKANASTFGALPLAGLARGLEHAELALVQSPALEALRQACDEALAALRELCHA